MAFDQGPRKYGVIRNTRLSAGLQFQVRWGFRKGAGAQPRAAQTEPRPTLGPENQGRNRLARPSPSAFSHIRSYPSLFTCSQSCTPPLSLSAHFGVPDSKFPCNLFGCGCHSAARITKARDGRVALRSRSIPID